MVERVIKRDEREYSKLQIVADALTLYSKNKAQYIVEDVYLDLGQDWMWTTICRKGYSECQVLSPRDWKMIMSSESMSDLAMCIDEIRNNEYFND